MTGTWVGRLLRLAAASLALMVAFSGTAGALEVWMPDTDEADRGTEEADLKTGEVNLDGLPRETLQARFRHAAGLIGAGQAISGVNQLRELLAEAPGAEWAERAHWLIALGLLAEGRNKSAFEACEALLARYAQSPRVQEAYEMQFQAARQRTLENLAAGQELYDRLTARAPSLEFETRCQKQRADAILEAGRFLRARDEYMALVDYYPDSAWVPYCWYKIAECDLRMAEKHRRGTEFVDRARRSLEGFTTRYADHTLSVKAKEKLAEVREVQAARYRKIAQYYLGPAKRPASALPYLDYIVQELADTEQAAWAKAKIREVVANMPTSPKGRFRELELPGVRLKKPEEAATEPEKNVGETR